MTFEFVLVTIELAFVYAARGHKARFAGHKARFDGCKA